MTPGEFQSTRTLTGLTQRELAEHLGVRADTIRKWETGISPIPNQRANQLADLADLADLNVESTLPCEPRDYCEALDVIERSGALDKHGPRWCAQAAARVMRALNKDPRP
jgi:transcriptional regulator with XRE-family HTH domain